MRTTLVLSYLLCLISNVALAQETVENQKKGKWSGQWRTFFMSTFNKGDLKDFYALASGGKIKYQYSFNNRLEFGAAVYNSTNLGLQDLTLPDPTTGRLSRYEEGLFDLLDLKNDAVFLLGELYINYRMPKHEFALGRMKINSPLVNPEDGRMIPTLTQGFRYQYRSTKSDIVQFGVFNQIAPRSTGRFYGIGESIGTYPVGRNPAGQTSGYAWNTHSDYLVLFNTELKVTESVQLNFWNLFVDNVSNSAYLKPTMRLNQKLDVEMEWLHQNKVGDGGNAIDSLRYFTSNTSDILGIRLNYRLKKSKVSLAYDRIFANGQFLSPREWGREDLFSFQKRERSEGSGDNHALVFDYDEHFGIGNGKDEIQGILSVGKHWKPSVSDAGLNKYAFPDYTQINLDLFFKFEKLKNLHPELLLVTKIANGDFPDNPNFYFNKTDMFHIDLILNYNF